MIGTGWARRLAAAGLGVALLAGVGAGRASAAEFKRVAERTFEFRPGGEVSIENQNGRVTVEGWDRPQVRVQITRVVRAPEQARAEAFLRELKADIEVGRNRIEIVSRYPKRRESIGLWDLVGQRVAQAQIHYYLQVPRETEIQIVTTNGPTRVQGLRGDVDAGSTNGPVTVRDVHGAVEAQTTNGSIELRAIDGSAKATTTNGSVLAAMRELRGRTGVNLITTNGSVEVYLPESIGATLQAMTTNGRVNVSFPVTSEGGMSPRSVRGTIGGGGAPVTLQTTNGNIDVRRYREYGTER